MTRILVFGRQGQVARALAVIGWPRSVEIAQLGRSACDLAVPGAARRAIAAHAPDIVINAAAYTAVDKAEREPEAARALNEAAPDEMARAAAAQGAALIHLSTDYVFDGTGARPWIELDECRPLSVYGATKAAGEAAIRGALATHVIVRTSWVFAPDRSNFVRTMLRLGAERSEVSVVGDQVGGPTAAADIAGAIARIAESLARGAVTFGTYHYAGAPDVSWHGFARAIFTRAAARGLPVPATVREITTAEYPTAARRPLNSRLDCRAILRDWGIERPSWETALDRTIDAIANEPRGVEAKG